MRAQIALALVSIGIGVGVGIALVLRGDAGDTSEGIAPETREAATHAEVEATEPDLREAVELPPEPRPASEVPLVLETLPEESATDLEVGIPPDLAELSAAELLELEQELTKSIEALTKEEYEARLRNGLGELVGTGNSLTDADDAWDSSMLMVLRAHPDGTWWKVVLPREEYPEAYALFDRRKAVRAALGRE